MRVAAPMPRSAWIKMSSRSSSEAASSLRLVKMSVMPRFSAVDERDSPSVSRRNQPFFSAAGGGSATSGSRASSGSAAVGGAFSPPNSLCIRPDRGASVGPTSGASCGAGCSGCSEGVGDFSGGVGGSTCGSCGTGISGFGFAGITSGGFGGSSAPPKNRRRKPTFGRSVPVSLIAPRWLPPRSGDSAMGP